MFDDNDGNPTSFTEYDFPIQSIGNAFYDRTYIIETLIARQTSPKTILDTGISRSAGIRTA